MFIEYEGRSQTIAAWAEQVGLSYATLYRRVRVVGEKLPHAFRPVAGK